MHIWKSLLGKNEKERSQESTESRGSYNDPRSYVIPSRIWDQNRGEGSGKGQMRSKGATKKQAMGFEEVCP